MTSNIIRTLLHAEPFIPFTVHVADQKSICVRHPDFATPAQGGRMFFVNPQDDAF